jgi:hypothetical protein
MQIRNYIALLGCAFSAVAVIVAPSKTELSKHAVLVPAEPTVGLPIPHADASGYPESPNTCKQLNDCLSTAGFADKQKSETALKSCVVDLCEELQSHNTASSPVQGDHPARKSLCDEKGKKVWDIVKTAKLEETGKHKASLVDMHSFSPKIFAAVHQVLLGMHFTVNQVNAICRAPGDRAKTSPQIVEVPKKPDVKLPTGKSDKAPMSCTKLDECLASAGETDQQSTDKFKKCFQSFCEDVHGDKTLKKDDSRTVLCDEKGKESWHILAEANSKVQAGLRATALAQKPKFSLVALRGHVHDVCRN